MVEWTKYNEFTELCDFAARVKVGDMIEISESYLTKNHWCVFYKLNSDDKALFDAEVFHLRPNCSSNGCTHKFRHLVAQKQFRINNKYDDTIKGFKELSKSDYTIKIENEIEDSRKCPTVCWNKSLYFATTIRYPRKFATSKSWASKISDCVLNITQASLCLSPISFFFSWIPSGLKAITNLIQ